MQVIDANPTFDGPRIKRIRAAYGQTQEQFALALDVTQRAVSMWERNRRQPRDYVTIDKLLRLERAIG